MKWPWHRSDEDKDELARVQGHLRRVRDQWPAVISESSKLRAHRERNHFADSIAYIFRGDR